MSKPPDWPQYVEVDTQSGNEPYGEDRYRISSTLNGQILNVFWGLPKTTANYLSIKTDAVIEETNYSITRRQAALNRLDKLAREILEADVLKGTLKLPSGLILTPNGDKFHK